MSPRARQRAPNVWSAVSRARELQLIVPRSCFISGSRGPRGVAEVLLPHVTVWMTTETTPTAEHGIYVQFCGRKAVRVVVHPQCAVVQHVEVRY